MRLLHSRNQCGAAPSTMKIVLLFHTGGSVITRAVIMRHWLPPAQSLGLKHRLLRMMRAGRGGAGRRVHWGAEAGSAGGAGLPRPE